MAIKNLVVDSVKFINERRAEVARYYPHKQQKTNECKFNESLLEVVVENRKNDKIM